MSTRPPIYPLPYDLTVQIEMLLEDLPDREDTVYRIRRLFGHVYAEGYTLGMLVGGEEQRRNASWRERQEDAQKKAVTSA